MAILEILKYPNPYLTEDNTKQVNPEIPDSVKELVSSMKETMEESKGKGLAATQVGKDLDIIIVTRATYTSTDVIAMINTEIIDKSVTLRDCQEGCLSIPGVFGFVKRHEWVKVKYLDEIGKEHTTTATGAFATIVQHEIDHLKGVLFIDRMSKKEYKRIDKLLKKLGRFYGE